MNLDQSMQAAGRAESWSDSIARVRESMTGRGEASRYLSETYGVDRRTAQKWLKGTQAPSEKGGRRAAVAADPVAARKAAAHKMRTARAVSVGKVGVVSRSSGKSAGSRNLGLLTLDVYAQGKLSEAADAYERGQLDKAQELASDAFLYAYASSRGDNPDAVTRYVEIGEYPTGVDFV